MSKFTWCVLAALVYVLSSGVVMAHCGSCGSDHEHEHPAATETKAEYTAGSCCSEDHFKSKQAAAAKEKAKAEYTEGSCCSADHYAEKKMKAEAGE